MPNRIIKDTVNESRGLSSCTFFAQDLYKRLITYADDYGRFNADPEIMLARLYPRDLATVTLCDINDALIELSGVRKIGFYTSAPRREVFACFPNWNEHQRIRDSKHKMPDPTDTTVNDWYYRRFIPLDMKIAIIERDGFKCKICGKPIAQCDDARRIAKMGTGLYHIDHVVPCQQGGRATMENLRLTCAKCNLSRQKSFTIDEIVQFSESRDDSPQLAANCGLIQSNTIQSESESESESESVIGVVGVGARAEDEDDAEVGDAGLVDYARQNLLSLSSGNWEDMRQFMDDGMPPDLVRYGIDQATAQGKSTWAYVQGILNRWLVDGIRTVGAAKEAEKRYQEAKSRGAPKHGNPDNRADRGASESKPPDEAEIRRIAELTGVCMP